MKPRKFTAEEDKYLKEVFPYVKTADVAKELNRTYQSVSQRAFQLRLKKKASVYRLYHDGDFLAEGTLEEIAEQLDLEEETIRYYIFAKDRPIRYSGYKKEVTL